MEKEHWPEMGKKPYSLTGNGVVLTSWELF